MQLTARQQQIAGLIGRGMRNRAIAHETGLAVDTVNAHIRAAAAHVPGDGYPRHKLLLWVLKNREILEMSQPPIRKGVP